MHQIGYSWPLRQKKHVNFPQKLISNRPTGKRSRKCRNPPSRAEKSCPSTRWAGCRLFGRTQRLWRRFYGLGERCFASRVSCKVKELIEIHFLARKPSETHKLFSLQLFAANSSHCSLTPALRRYLFPTRRRLLSLQLFSVSVSSSPQAPFKFVSTSPSLSKSLRSSVRIRLQLFIDHWQSRSSNDWKGFRP